MSYNYGYSLRSHGFGIVDTETGLITQSSPIPKEGFTHLLEEIALPYQGNSKDAEQPQESDQDDSISSTDYQELEDLEVSETEELSEQPIIFKMTALQLSEAANLELRNKVTALQKAKERDEERVERLGEEINGRDDTVNHLKKKIEEARERYQKAESHDRIFDKLHEHNVAVTKEQAEQRKHNAKQGIAFTRLRYHRLPHYMGDESKTDTVSSFLQKFEGVCDELDVPGKERCIAMGDAVEKSAQTWLENQTTDRYNWDRLKANMITRFDTENNKDRLRQTINKIKMTIGQSLASYLEEMSKILQHSTERETWKVNKFIMGLLPEYQMGVVTARPATLQEAMEIVQTNEKVALGWGKIFGGVKGSEASCRAVQDAEYSDPRPSEKEKALTSEVDELREKLEKMQLDVMQTKGQVISLAAIAPETQREEPSRERHNTAGNSFSQEMIDNMEAYLAQIQGPNKPRYPQQANGPQRFNTGGQAGGSDRGCFYCGRPGHIKADCRTMKREQQQGPSRGGRPQYGSNRSSQSGLTCFHCGKVGHTRKVCRTLQAEMQQFHGQGLQGLPLQRFEEPRYQRDYQGQRDYQQREYQGQRDYEGQRSYQGQRDYQGQRNQGQRSQGQGYQGDRYTNSYSRPYQGLN